MIPLLCNLVKKQQLKTLMNISNHKNLMQKKTGIKTYVSLYKFDGYSLKTVYSFVDVKEVKPLNEESYSPQGMTNLLDAIGGVLMQINKDFSEKKKRDRSSVIVTVLTDGHENASKTFQDRDVKQMVEKAEGKNWGFMFLGANINAFSAGSNLGFRTENTLQFNTKNVSDTIRSASGMTSRMKTAYSMGEDTSTVYMNTAFTDSERKASIGDTDD